jgi:hypothetical protein
MRCLSAVAASGVALIVAADASPILDQSTVDQVNSDPCVQLKTQKSLRGEASMRAAQTESSTLSERRLSSPILNSDCSCRTGRRHGLPR